MTLHILLNSTTKKFRLRMRKTEPGAEGAGVQEGGKEVGKCGQILIVAESK